MKRTQSRAGSPTNTVFSGISNYRNESYRASTKNAPAVPTIDYRAISKVHFDELASYLAVYLSTASPESRSNARQKLTRLTIQQFHELSTDVYDELCRRKKDKDAVPFLPVREDFHPKRNQARQKLATLPNSRFEDLSSDVYFELVRRYPEFQDEPPTASSASNYDDYPSPDFQPKSSGLGRSNSRPTEERSADSGYGGSRRPSEDRRRPSEQFDNSSSGRRSEEERSYTASVTSRRKPSQDLYSGSGSGSGSGRANDEDRGYTLSMASSRRKPSQDTTRSGFHGRQQSAGAASDTTSTANAQSTTAASGMVIPTKSTITEEVIEVPYGRDRDTRGSSSTMNDDMDPDESDLSARSPMGGLSGLSARLRQDEDDDDVIVNGNNRSNDEYYERSSFGRASASSDRSIGGINSKIGGRTSASGNIGTSEDQERLRRDYEFKIATMQTQISSLQRDLTAAQDSQDDLRRSNDKVRQLEDELLEMRRRTEEQSATMKALNKELDEVRESRLQERDRSSRREQEGEEEIRSLRERIEELEAGGTGGGSADPQVVEQLRNDMDNLFNDLTELSQRNDDLLAEKENDILNIRELDTQLREYKRKYEQAKTELRSSRATSQLYMQGVKQDRSVDQLPVSPDGGLLDIHVTAFLSGIDSLLTAGRSNAPSSVLSPMKSIVHAATSLIDDARAFESSRGMDQADIDPGTISSLCERAEATLSNLVAASRTHSTSSGMSPVSLLDAAASHLSATITDLGKTINIRKASKAEQERFNQSTQSPSGHSTGSPASVKFADDVRYGSPSHMRKASTTSNGSNRRTDQVSSPLSARQPLSSKRFSPPSGGSSQTGSATKAEDAWLELKPYLEAQTESIVYAIQSVLSGVRGPNPPPSLNENVTQIITIVSSIVAVCNDNLPPASAQQGQEILRELTDHANRLSEVQASGENSKESRQIMAKSSFAVANGMKGLMKL